MSSFWVVKNGVACEHVGRPRSFGNVSFAYDCNDSVYLQAGLYLDKQWEGTYDPRIHHISIPSFVVNEIKREVQTTYVVTDKTQSKIDTYDAEQAAAQAAILAEQERIAQKAKDISTNLPSWSEISTSIDNASTIVAMRVIVKNMARVVYWLAKDKAE